jgi:hypothetical protein
LLLFVFEKPTLVSFRWYDFVQKFSLAFLAKGVEVKLDDCCSIDLNFLEGFDALTLLDDLYLLLRVF